MTGLTRRPPRSRFLGDGARRVCALAAGYRAIPVLRDRAPSGRVRKAIFATALDCSPTGC
ncbi:hypothetical protein ACFORO_05160 [Amycolatopsis halotolerans]|uniref:Uncharacterized protein n=1 Tax=Amycolatopsis halotolerans TaxID=330083 RepID=A0ABV7QCD7_9PSEU